MKKNLILPAAITGCLTALCLLSAERTAAAPKPDLQIQDTPISRETRSATSLAPVIKKVGPSVVNIYSTTFVRQRQRSTPFSDPFGRQFNFDGEQDGSSSRPRSQRRDGGGSGVIVSADGYILTANHVVEGADQIKVALANGEKQYTATVIGRDPATDVAVLKIEADRLPAITLTDSDKLEVGDMVLALGNPFGVGQTVTMGIVSGVGRGGFGVTGYENFIQTDAAINPGNSGGALVDAEGRLIGINTWIVSGSGGSDGIGFAVPINQARYVMDRLITDGKVKRGFLGLSLQEDLTPGLVEQLDLPNANGALVTRVEAGTPAEKAGFKREDFIVDFDGKKIADMRQFRLAVSQTAPGAKVNVKLYRAGKEKTLVATLGELPADQFADRRGRPQDDDAPTGDALEGVDLVDLTPRVYRQTRIPTSVQGALVTSVDPASDAYEAGLRPGDVIEAINRQAVTGADEALELMKSAKNSRVVLRVWSGGGTKFVPIDESKGK